MFTKENVDNADKIVSAAGHVKSCIQPILNMIPPSFAMKKGGDWGKIPTRCPPGFFRSLALCHENCKSGYSWDGGFLCRKNCPSGWNSFWLTCSEKWKWDFWNIKTITRDTYWMKTLTNFNNRV